MKDLHNMLDVQNKAKKEFSKTQNEKSFFLGEYKERVLAALEKDQIEEDEVYEEIFDAMKDENSHILKMSRDLPLKKLKPYIQKAEELKLKYQLVDGIGYFGNIGLVVAAKEALINPPNNVLIRDMDQDFIDADLGEIYSKNKGSRLCKEHYKALLDKLPEYEKDFKKLDLLDKLLGRKCVVCKGEKKSGGN